MRSVRAAINKSGLWLGVGALVMMGATAGCVDELYSACDLDPQSADTAQRLCADDEGASGDGLSCAISGVTQCETRVCARYNGSSTFCTQRCTSDDDCVPGGTCQDFDEIRPGTLRYCVPDSPP